MQSDFATNINLVKGLPNYLSTQQAILKHVLINTVAIMDYLMYYRRYRNRWE
jgi:hypothetical protein